jgi:hypothetical protein
VTVIDGLIHGLIYHFWLTFDFYDDKWWWFKFNQQVHPTMGCLGIIVPTAPRTSHRSPFGILERTFHQLMSCTSAPLWPPWVERPGRDDAGCWTASENCGLLQFNSETQQC